MKFEYEPLGRVVEGLESSADLTPEQIKAKLRSNGYDPDALTRKIQDQVRALSAQSRLAWQEVGRERQAKLNTVLASLKSWTRRSVADIDRAFGEVLDGRYGPRPQLQLRTAFNNLSEVTTESKAAFLDEIDALLALDRNGASNAAEKEKR